ncbi:hypothetical protein HDU80_001194, partial [Chytriomyces hyalinus]
MAPKSASKTNLLTRKDGIEAFLKWAMELSLKLNSVVEFPKGYRHGDPLDITDFLHQDMPAPLQDKYPTWPAIVAQAEQLPNPALNLLYVPAHQAKAEDNSDFMTQARGWRSIQADITKLVHQHLNDNLVKFIMEDPTSPSTVKQRWDTLMWEINHDKQLMINMLQEKLIKIMQLSHETPLEYIVRADDLVICLACYGFPDAVSRMAQHLEWGHCLLFRLNEEDFK